MARPRKAEMFGMGMRAFESELRELTEAGLPPRVIGERYGVGVSRIRYWLTRFGLALNPDPMLGKGDPNKNKERK